jgi:hypothetical protein
MEIQWGSVEKAASCLRINWVFVNKVTNFEFYKVRGISYPDEDISFSRKFLFHKVSCFQILQAGE